tara:strand:- start:72 stop:623 length:552 start_codon:yes stop_codon:yes gene_type:complete
MSNLNKSLIKVQSELKAPKGQRNKFGNYNYRSAEDILEAVKPLLAANNLSMQVSDTVQEVAGIPYIESMVIVSDGVDNVMVTAQAGIDPNRKGMDIAQCFGASSSYARKYALNGMFLIDDTKDPDATNQHGNTSAPAPASKPKLTKEVMSKMAKAIEDGKADMVKSALNKYEVTASQRKELLG